MFFEPKVSAIPPPNCLDHLGGCKTKRNNPICIVPSKVTKGSKTTVTVTRVFMKRLNDIGGFLSQKHQLFLPWPPWAIQHKKQSNLNSEVHGC